MDNSEKEVKNLELAIAGHIKEERLKHGWTLDKLAKMTGLSKGYLSQIENNEKNPPIGTLTKIAYGLGISVLELISGEAQTMESTKLSIVRKDQQKTITHAEAAEGSIYNSFGFSRPDRLMDPYAIVVGHEYPPKPLIHSGQEIAYTLVGKHEFYYDGQTYVLEAGDAIYFDSDRPHMSRSLGKKPAKILVIFCNPAGRE
ncbi:MAG: helix-turn-helix domain-containing protein [Desulfobacteraceae bacterium]|nr:helix-turn-helix domain-containing protein [Desulfobacteraceae bacterium]